MPFRSLIVAGRVAILLVALQCTGIFLGWAGALALSAVLPIPSLSDRVFQILGAVAAGFLATGSVARVGAVRPAMRLALSAVSVLIAVACFQLGPSPDADGLRGDFLGAIARRVAWWGCAAYLLVLALRLPTPAKK